MFLSIHVFEKLKCLETMSACKKNNAPRSWLPAVPFREDKCPGHKKKFLRMAFLTLELSASSSYHHIHAAV